MGSCCSVGHKRGRDSNARGQQVSVRNVGRYMPSHALCALEPVTVPVTSLLSASLLNSMSASKSGHTQRIHPHKFVTFGCWLPQCASWADTRIPTRRSVPQYPCVARAYLVALVGVCSWLGQLLLQLVDVGAPGSHVQWVGHLLHGRKSECVFEGGQSQAWCLCRK